MNKVILIGNLTRDPELLTAPDGIAYCRFGIAVNRRFSKNKDEVDFFNVIVWRQQAENCAKYLKKGSKAGVVGSVQIRSFEKDGEKRQSVEVSADEVEFLSAKGSVEGGDDAAAAFKKPREVSDLEPIDDDLPF